MQLKEKRIGFALTGSFCSIDKVLVELERLIDKGAKVTPILSTAASTFDTRFGQGRVLRKTLEEMTGTSPLTSIVDVEPIGPKGWLDLLIIAPCTGNTLAKLALGITDDTVAMAAKAQLRNHRPILIGISTNDGLGTNAKNLGILLVTKNIFFIPFGQDDPYEKKNSLVSQMSLLCDSIEKALVGIQIQPLLIQYNHKGGRR